MGLKKGILFCSLICIFAATILLQGCAPVYIKKGYNCQATSLYSKKTFEHDTGRKSYIYRNWIQKKDGTLGVHDQAFYIGEDGSRKFIGPMYELPPVVDMVKDYRFVNDDSAVIFESGLIRFHPVSD